ncbi:uncharacterized protein TNCV_2285951 [Trichonephila clavipes]|nr:uncharacterized protein TNCV_2285951 [Trichonephila clavipes]
MLIYELPASSLKCGAQPNVIRRSFEPHDQMLYHRTILEPHTAYQIPAGTHYIVLTVQKTAFGLDIISESLLPQLIQKGFHLGDFRKMKKFNQTPYKLPPPTPIHVPAEKRPLEEKALPKKRVRITPVMRRVSRRSEIPMAPVQLQQPPVQIPDVLELVQIPDVPQSPVQIPLVPQSPVPIPDVPPSPVHIPQPPVQIPDVLETVQIPLVPQSPVKIPDVPEPTVQIPLVQIPDVLEPVQIPLVPQSPVPIPDVPPSPVQIPDVPEPPVQIPLVQIPDVQNLCRFQMSKTCADSRCPRTTCADSRCSRTCADSRCSRTCADSSVTSPTATYADSTCIRTCADSTCIRTCANSSVTSPTATYADSTCIRTCAGSSVTSPTVTCADSTCAEPPRTYAASPRARHFGPFGVDRCIRPAHVVCIWTPRTPAASHGTLYF